MNASHWLARVSACATATLVAAASLSGAALAQTAPASPADCHRIDSASARLACYDAVSGRNAGSTAQQTLPAAAAAATTQAAPVVAAPPIATADAVGREVAGSTSKSMIDSAWDFDPGSPRYDIRFYNANYFLFGRYTDSVNNAPYLPLTEALGEPPPDLNSTEAKFQLSFKTRVWATDDRKLGVWVGYTQQNQWQVYNGDTSRPFRETNYMPEVFVSWGPDIDLGAGFRWKLLNAGYNHQSNGRTDTLSRSWDRLFAQFGVERENLALFGKVWYRLKENEADDDNPDITDYYGHGEISGLYRWRDNSFAAGIRGNLSTGKGAVQFGWTSPPLFGLFRGYVQVFSGYGESLIDYNWRQTTIGAGVALSDGL
jgi:phospholipase A1/A2